MDTPWRLDRASLKRDNNLSPPRRCLVAIFGLNKSLVSFADVKGVMIEEELPGN